jgi:predicted dehydrogenase
LVNRGALGKTILADARVKWYRPPEYYGNSRWRGTLALDGGGALINQGVHTVDLLLWLLGDSFEWVRERQPHCIRLKGKIQQSQFSNLQVVR